MRGLTPAEHGVLSFMASIVPGVEAIEFPSCDVEETTERLVAGGRVRTYRGEDDRGFYTRYAITDAGRLALRLWPATMATPGAGDHQ